MSTSAHADRIVVAVLAHQEERRIARCLASLPLGQAGVEVHVLVNGSRDRTADIARSFTGAIVHEWTKGGKSRSWNRFVHDECAPGAAAYIFVDGDAEVAGGSIDALLHMLAVMPATNAAAAMPGNGRRAAQYRAAMIRDHGLFGDLYALRGGFVDRMRIAGIRLPDDCIGEDGLIGAMAKTDLGPESAWLDARVAPCPDALFLCEQVGLANVRSWTMQYRRMRSYSIRHFQNRIISAIMRNPGPAGLPRQLASLYSKWLPHFRPRSDPRWWWFDRQALARMHTDAAAFTGT